MKRYCKFGIMVLMIFLYGCSGKNLSVSDLKPSTIVVDTEHVNALVKEGEIASSEEEINLVLENKTEYKYFYGLYFTLEIQSNNIWYIIPFAKNSNFIERGMILNSNSQDSMPIKLSEYFDYLPEGKYRIVKSLYLDAEEIIVVAPFEIKNK